MSAPVFVREFQRRQLQERLKLNKYTRWASELSDAHLQGLLWFVGEFRARGFCLLELFDSDPEVLALSRAGARQAKSQLQCLMRFCEGDRFDANEAKRRFAQGRSRMGISDLPESVRSAVARAAPGRKWKFVSMSEYGYEFSGNGESDRVYGARVDHEGRFTFRIGLSESAMPEAAQAAFRKAFPDLGPDPGFCYGISADNQEFLDYEVRVPQEPKSLWILVSADGKHIRPAREFGRALIFPEAFRDSLNIGKYTRWASDLSEVSLQSLFWLLGALATETLPTLKPVSAYVDLTPWPNFNALRPRFGLEGIFRVVTQGERFDVDQVCDFIEKGERQFHRECLRAVPFSVRRAVERVVPRATWKHLERVDKSEKEYRFFGEDERGRDFWVTVSHDDGRVEVGTVVSEEDVPGPVLAAFKAQLPESRAIDRIQAIGPDRQTVDHYRTYVTLRPGQSRLIVVSADGTKVEVSED